MKLDPDDIRSYEQRAYFDKHEQKGPSGLIIFVAVLGAILAAWAIREAYMQWQVEQALKAFNQQMAMIAARNQVEAQRRLAEQEALRLQDVERLRLEREERIQAENEKREANVALVKQVAQKERAWEAFYKPIPGCEKSNPNRETIKCGNDYMRAKNQFESEWWRTTK